MVLYVIFGYKLNKHNKIHPILKKRLDLFISKYKKSDKVILSGGNTPKNTHKNTYTEAYIMSKYIRKFIDIKKTNILIENKSMNTIENVIFSFKIIKQMNINRVTIISSIWHLNRIKKIVKYISERSLKVKYLGSGENSRKTKKRKKQEKTRKKPGKKRKKQTKKPGKNKRKNQEKTNEKTGKTNEKYTQ